MKFLSLFALVSLFAVACSNNDDDNTTVNGMDAYFMQQASFSNYDEISAGTIASTHASDDSVRMFGTMMVTDHTMAQASLDSLASSLSVNVPSTPDSVHLAMAAMLQTLSGNVFDTTYIGAQVRDHMLTVSIFQQEISGGNNQQVKNFAQKNLPMIQMHLQEAQSIQQRIQ